MRFRYLLLFIFWIQFALAQSLPIVLEKTASQLTAPLGGGHAGDGSGRLFIVEQVGRIRILNQGELLPTPFLDLRGKMVRLNSGYDERGLLGLAFHPDYAANGRFFVYYSAPGGSGNHTSVVAEYHVSTTNPNRAGTEERILLEIPQPEPNHNGGHLAFGPDGMLYIGLGDGGGANDQHGRIGNGQDRATLLGSILRIDVDGGEPYSIPPDNPFFGQAGREEIWAYGLRNPWKFSFDRGAGQRLFCGDVGQNKWEEIDLIVPGGNYGWRVMEGFHCFNPSRGCDETGKILPIAEYGHSAGISVTGGYVYRGRRYSSLVGKYIFADWVQPFFSLEENSMGEWVLNELDVSPLPSGTFVLGFMEDEQGELYALTSRSSSPVGTSGAVYHITVPGDSPVSAVPAWRRY